MSNDNLNLTSLSSLQEQEDRLHEIQRSHIARLLESGILKKVQSAYVAEYAPIPSGGGRAALNDNELLSGAQYTVSHTQNKGIEHVMIMKDQYYPVVLGTITTAEGNAPKIEANKKIGFNAVDVRSVASMVEELVGLKRSGELSDLSDDLQHIEPKIVEQAIPVDQPPVAVIAAGVDLEEAVRLLSYCDVLPEPYQKDAIDAIKKGETTLDYAKELVAIYKDHGRQKVDQLAREMVQSCANVLNQKNISPTIYAPSTSWALWDIAKQSYIAKHPDKSPPECAADLEDPFAESAKGEKKRLEICEKHIGWEIMRRADQGEVRIADLPTEAQKILASGQRNETGQLSSYELAKLGHLVSASVKA